MTSEDFTKHAAHICQGMIKIHTSMRHHDQKLVVEMIDDFVENKLHAFCKTPKEREWLMFFVAYGMMLAADHVANS